MCVVCPCESVLEGKPAAASRGQGPSQCAPLQHARHMACVTQHDALGHRFSGAIFGIGPTWLGAWLVCMCRLADGFVAAKAAASELAAVAVRLCPALLACSSLGTHWCAKLVHMQSAPACAKPLCLSVLMEMSTPVGGGVIFAAGLTRAFGAVFQFCIPCCFTRYIILMLTCGGSRLHRGGGGGVKKE